MEIKWTNFADHKLSDIFDFYELIASARIAGKLIDGIIKQTITLKGNPYIGKVEESLPQKSETFRFLVHKSYKIIYWIDEKEDTVHIVNIFDTRQNPTKIENFK